MQTLDPRLVNDSYLMGTWGKSQLLLIRNALYPWFVIVPETKETEFYLIESSQQLELLEQINILSGFIKSHFNSEKLNVATIGNVVSQMHIHVVGRRSDDSGWPGVVWGRPEFLGYEADEVESIRQALIQQVSDFVPVN